MTTLAHHIDVAFLREAYRRTRKDGATGIDGRTAKDHAEDLEGNLEDLLARFNSGRYRAPAVRRAHIPKGGGKTRPIGIPTFEDKVLQPAVTMVLGAVYEQDFLDCSYGFRPGRSAHDALAGVWEGSDGDARRLGLGGRHPVVLRRPRPRPSSEFSGPEGVRRSATSRDRQVVEGRCARRRAAAAEQGWYATRRSGLAAAGQRLPAFTSSMCGSRTTCARACAARHSWCAMRMMSRSRSRAKTTLGV